MVRLGLTRNIWNHYYPTFEALYFLAPDLRDGYAILLDLILKAIRALYESAPGPKQFSISEVEQRMNLLISASNSPELNQLRVAAPGKDLHFVRAAFFLQDFTLLVSAVLNNPNTLVSAVTATDNILDYEDLQEAWKQEVALRPRPQPSPTPPKPPQRIKDENAAATPPLTAPEKPGEHATVEDQANRATEAANAGRAQPEPTSASKPEQPKLAAESTAATTRLPDVWMLSDRPIESHFAEQDRFQFKDYASALAAVLDHEKTETPFTMAINAPWGAGKTTLANMIAEQLRQRPKDRGQTPHIICWFNAWMHDDAQNLGTAFISEVGRIANLHRAWPKRLLSPLPSALREPSDRKRRRIASVLISIPLILLLSSWVGSHLERIEQHKKYEASKSEVRQTTKTVVSDTSGKDISSSKSEMQSGSYPVSPVPPEPFALDKMDWFLEKFESRMLVLGAFFTALAGLLGLLAKLFTSTALGSFVESPDKAAETGAIQSAEKQLKKLISQATWRGNRFIVFVDDVERCKPPRSVDVLDAVNQLMDHRGVVVVFLGDMSAVAAAAQLKYKDLADIFVPSTGIALTGPDRGKEVFGRLYLQKIVQFQFDLPIPPMTEIQEYMKQLADAPEAGGSRDGRT